MQRLITWVLIVTLLWATPVVAAPLAAPAEAPAREGSGPPIGTVVGTGTPETCTSETLRLAVGDLQNLGGGAITFNCGDAPHTIVVSPTLVITSDISFDGGNLGDITLSGNDVRQVFFLQPGAYLGLNDMVVTAGYLYDGYGGCIGSNTALLILLRTTVHSCNAGTVLSTDRDAGPATEPIVAGTSPQGGAIGAVGGVTILVASQVLSSTVSGGGGGGIYSTGSLKMDTTRVAGNQAGSGGGLIVAGTAEIDSSLLEHNQAGYGGGLSTFLTARVTIDGSRLYSNTASVSGGGLYMHDTLTITHSTLEENVATAGGGGGLYVVTGTASLAQLRVLSNRADDGGGLYLNGGALNLNQAIIDDNEAVDGGGIANFGARATLSNATISHNFAHADGGGYFDTGANGFSAFSNVTVSGNTASSVAGGVKSVKVLTMTNVTIANNIADLGGGFYRTNDTSPYSWRNVLVAANLAGGNPQNCNEYLPTSVTKSLSSDDTCLATGLNANLPLGPLAFNGGVGNFTMPTHLSLAGSAAINGGTNSGIPLTDQRGAPRPSGGVADVGAVESDALISWLWLPGIFR